MTQHHSVQPLAIEAFGPVHPHTLGLEVIQMADNLNYHNDALAAKQQIYEVVHGINVDRPNPDHARRRGRFAISGEVDSETKLQAKAAYEADKEWHGLRAEENASELVEEIGAVRQFLRDLDGEDRDLVKDEVYAILPTRTLNRALNSMDHTIRQGNDVDLLDWLTNQHSVTLMEQGAPPEEIKGARISEDARILTFLRAHRRKIEARQARPEFVHGVDVAKKFWKTSVIDYVDQGWVHPSAAERADNIDQLKVYEGDQFSTTLAGNGGYYHRDMSRTSRSVVLSRNEIEVAEHEFNHAELEVFPSDLKAEFNYTWLYESITEELALAMQTLTEPGRSNLKEGCYPGMRGLLRDLINVAQQRGSDIVFKDFSYAYSAPEQEQAVLTKDINRRLREAIPHSHPNILQVVHKSYLTALSRVKIKFPDMKFIKQIDLAASVAQLDVLSWLDAPK